MIASAKIELIRHVHAWLAASPPVGQMYETFAQGKYRRRGNSLIGEVFEAPATLSTSSAIRRRRRL
jgi:hypothetical protein